MGFLVLRRSEQVPAQGYSSGLRIVDGVMMGHSCELRLGSATRTRRR